MSQRLCGVGYTTVEAGEPLHLACQYLAGHPSERHSWYARQQADTIESAARRVLTIPPAVHKVIAAVRDGSLDEWLELLLAEAHDRKRARRGVAGFR